jgi:hypothetical protein
MAKIHLAAGRGFDLDQTTARPVPADLLPLMAAAFLMIAG